MKYAKYIFIAFAFVLFPSVSFGAVTFSAQSVTAPTDYPGNTIFNYTVTATGADIGRSIYVGSKTSSNSVDVFDPTFCHVLSGTATAYSDNILMPPAPYVDFYYFKFASADCTGSTSTPQTNFFTTTWTVPYPGLTPSDTAFLQSECTVDDNQVCIYSGSILLMLSILAYFLVFCLTAVLVYNLGKRIMK